MERVLGFIRYLKKYDQPKVKSGWRSKSVSDK